MLCTDALTTVLRKGKHCIVHSFLAPTIKSCIEDYLELRRNAPLHEWEEDPEFPEDEFTITMIANTAHTRYAVRLNVMTIGGLAIAVGELVDEGAGGVDLGPGSGVALEGPVELVDEVPEELRVGRAVGQDGAAQAGSIGGAQDQGPGTQDTSAGLR